MHTPPEGEIHCCVDRNLVFERSRETGVTLYLEISSSVDKSEDIKNEFENLIDRCIFLLRSKNCSLEK